jgi:hypothetical protein
VAARRVAEAATEACGIQHFLFGEQRLRRAAGRAAMGIAGLGREAGGAHQKAGAAHRGEGSHKVRHGDLRQLGCHCLQTDAADGPVAPKVIHRTVVTYLFIKSKRFDNYPQILTKQ